MFYFKFKSLTPYSLLKVISILFLSIILLSSCTIPSMMNPDNYGRNHTVYAVDFNPKDLNSIILLKMDEGNWENMGKVKNNEDAKFSILIKHGYMTVQSNEKEMDIPTYQTWLNYARTQLGYTTESEYDIFDTVKKGWVYDVNLKKHPLVDGENHRILMYEIN
ncbi:hypothetical protein L1I30_07160 [Gillisia sp. M10.2A]|uniref:Lipoprotein n=1 Tax=Gillisia lutea TaxID=2909668 RepID=A0ABS9EEZ1_9FLAO|nr:hypothetical protein [Gillisia lutea]MCF4101438.1 hypothetical protein [Gillisia lutea]